MSKLILSLILSTFVIASAYSDVFVHSYRRADGTFVKSHHRSDPDGNINNNWSTKGNINPYTGEPGTKSPNPKPAPSLASGLRK